LAKLKRAGTAWLTCASNVGTITAIAGIPKPTKSTKLREKFGNLETTMPPIRDIDIEDPRRVLSSSDWCPDCGEPRGVCRCTEGAAQDDADDEDLDLTCSCPLCFCSNITIAGEPCIDCMSGAHQR
jgi:hypothetical protein